MKTYRVVDLCGVWAVEDTNTKELVSSWFSPENAAKDCQELNETESYQLWISGFDF